MPTYDYVCNACDHKFEEFQSIKANPLKKCPACGKMKLNRLIGTGSAVIFKGSGFYQTDYRSDSYTMGAKSESSSKPADTAKTETGKESKSETKPETKSEPKTEMKSESKDTKSETKESKPTPPSKPDKKKNA
ncbi:MAG: zinc ribbon domain-containing protein [Sedimentisphaerales bacterium]|nr:zinc ribbon domain-containing protein [Sedimentisphaerales bacterium]